MGIVSLCRYVRCDKIWLYGTGRVGWEMATASPRWTFITNHGLVLSFIFHNSRSTAREIANYIGVTERTTHKIISDLEVAGYIERRKEGRRNVYRVNPSLPLRHHTKQDVMVDELLEALTNKNQTEAIAE